VPVFVFAYDWRQPLARSELKLEAFVAEVIDRTKLLRYYYGTDWYETPHVDLVGHSMGGMLIAGYLERLKKKARVGKVATIRDPVPRQLRVGDQDPHRHRDARAAAASVS